MQHPARNTQQQHQQLSQANGSVTVEDGEACWLELGSGRYSGDILLAANETTALPDLAQDPACCILPVGVSGWLAMRDINRQGLWG